MDLILYTGTHHFASRLADCAAATAAGAARSAARWRIWIFFSQKRDAVAFIRGDRGWRTLWHVELCPILLLDLLRRGAAEQPAVAAFLCRLQPNFLRVPFDARAALSFAYITSRLRCNLGGRSKRSACACRTFRCPTLGKPTPAAIGRTLRHYARSLLIFAHHLSARHKRRGLLLGLGCLSSCLRLHRWDLFLLLGWQRAVISKAGIEGSDELRNVGTEALTVCLCTATQLHRRWGSTCDARSGPAFEKGAPGLFGSRCRLRRHFSCGLILHGCSIDWRCWAG